MDRSKFSNILANTRLLKHFSQENVEVIKEYIFDQLGCQNESDFICQALKSLYTSMSVESTANIKRKTAEIDQSRIRTPT